MYVTSRGVTDTNPRETGFDPFAQTNEYSQRSQTLLARRNFIQRANSLVGLVLLGALVLSSALAYAIRSNAEALVPNSVRSFGHATALDNPQISNGEEIIGISSSPNEQGYWIATKQGHVYPYGDVKDFGSIPQNEVNNIVDIASTPTGRGYWLMADDGAVFTFGDAVAYGTPESIGVTEHSYVAILPTPSGQGYTLIQDTGDVLTFGNAKSFGSAAGQLGGDFIVDANATPTGEGYLMVSAKGAVVAFGDAVFSGAMSAGQLTGSAVSIQMTESTFGYWILATDGGVFSFGDADFHGSAVETDPTDLASSVDFALPPGKNGYWIVNGKSVPKPAKIAVRTANASLSANNSAVSNADNADVWARLRNCESHGNYQTNTGNGYYGAYQFSAATWNSMNTGYAYAHEAPPEVQDDAARRLQARSGWGQWPVCSRNAGAR